MLLAVLLLLGIAFARRALGLSRWAEAITIGLALAQVLLLLPSNAALRWVGWSIWPQALAVFFVVLAWLIWLLPAKGPEDAGPVLRSVWLLALASFLYAVLLQSQEMDDDYWIHAPIQGLLLKGDFPPHNPFFPTLQLNGHYGRDLLIVIWARLTGLTTYTTQFWVTALLQPLQILVSYWAVRRGSGSRASALGATFFLGIGVQVASRAGLWDTLQNNNPVAQLYLLLVLYLLLGCWSRLREDMAWAWVVTLGVVLGGLAIVYETHFALCCAASLVTIGRGLLSSPRPGRVMAASLLVVVVAMGLACSQGGPLTDLARRVTGRAHKEMFKDASSSTQSQHVEIHFPKKNLFCLRCGTLTHLHVKTLPSGNWLYESYQMSDPGEGYLPLWSWAVLSQQSWPFFLSPVVLWLALRYGRLPSLWLVTLGYAAFWVPLVVDFGPIFEAEYLRWEFAAGLGFAGALGAELGPWVNSHRSRLPLAAVAVLVWMCTANARHNAENLLRLLGLAAAEGRPLVVLGTQDWLVSQVFLDFTGGDWKAVQWLSAHSQFGQSVLIDTPQESSPQALFDSTVGCLTGLKPAGLRLPLVDDMVGIPPYRKRPAVRCYLRSGDPQYLDLDRPDWIFLRRSEATPHPEVTWESVAGRQIGRLKPLPARWPQTVLLGEPAGSTPVLGDLPEHVHEGQLLQLSWNNPDGRRLVLVPQAAGQAPDFEDAIVYPAGSRGGWWAAPYRRGQYDLQAYAWDAAGLHPLGSMARLRLDLSEQMGALRLEKIDFDRTLRAGNWARVRFQLSDSQLDGLDCLAYLSFTRGASSQDALVPVRAGRGEGRVSEIPHSQMQAGKVQKRQLELWTPLPAAAGRYRVDLFLSASFGNLLRLRGFEVEVLP
ncbi:MAG: hypothetical protein KF760_15280 [Candidatus Eremiobacteraeota bacterium]|nr:hypothetical protein [Candidatus Eremiobacteraeota bacterium]MCW5869481.1 hypothetical protein [Candidatus Eremiobacteraeota bacterium]